MKRNHTSSKLIYLIPLLVTVMLVMSRGYWQWMEMKSYDIRVNLLEKVHSSAVGSTGSVVLVGIEEDETFKTKPLIFWYPDIGIFLRNMNHYGAKAVAMDIIPVASLGERIVETVSSVVGDDLSEDRHSFIESFGQKIDHSLLGAMIEVSDRMPIFQGTGDGTVPFFYSSMAFMENVRPVSARIEPDPDYVMRRQNTTYSGLDTLSHALYRNLAGKPFSEKQVILNYSLRRSIPYFLFSNVITGKIPAAAFAGKGVILGYVDKAIDVQPTPVKKNMPGPLIQAVAVETMLTGTQLNLAPTHLQLAAIILLAVCGAVLSIRLRPVPCTLLLLLLSLLYCSVNIFLLAQGTIVPLFPQVLAPFAVFGVVYPYRYLVEERDRRKLYRMFSYYVDHNFIDSLMEKEAESLLKGEYKNMTVVFIDIRDFTQFCDRLPADQTVRLLNLYFDRMAGIIQRHNGVIDKFIGDAILAFFWDESELVAPAVSASREMLLAVDQMAEDPEIKQILGEWRLSIGIGLHYGSVLMGNIGSDKKMDFTIIGTTVNIASRLENLNKQLKTRLLVSEEAYISLKNNRNDLEYIGKFAIRGIAGEQSLYTLSEDAGQVINSTRCSL